MTDELKHEYRRYLSDHPGHPLGPGMPLGRALRIDWFNWRTQSWRGESHYEWWQRLLRLDPCAYCGREGGTVDHIEPRTPLIDYRGISGSPHSWTNLTGACDRCNSSKGHKNLLLWFRSR